jgi:gliding motility-associated-like protein
MKKIIFIFSVVVIFLLQREVKAINISSNAVTGNWNAGASWVGGVVPTKNDTAIIVSGSTITVDLDTSKCYKLKINSGGVLNLSTHILRCCGSLVSKFVSPTTYWFIGNGHCTIYSGGTLNMNTGTLCLTGDLTTNGTFNCGTGTVIFDTKRAPLSVYGLNIPTFYKVINNDSIPASFPVAGGFGVTLHNDNTIFTGDIVINGSFNRNSSATNDTVDITFAGTTNLSGVYSFYLNDVIINSGATLNAGSKTIYLYGDWTCNGTFTCGTSTIWFSRDPNNALVQNIYQANPTTNPFYNIYVNKSSGSVTQLSGVLNANGNINVLNNFTVNKGTYDMGGIHRLYVGGNFVVNGANGGIYNASTGRLLMNGTNAVTQQTLNTGGSALYKYTIDNSGAGVIQASDVTITYECQFTNGIQYTKNGATLYELYLSSNDPALSLPAGYSATSFVVGKFRRAVTGANNYTFPVGPLNTVPVIYRPITYQETAAGGASNLFITEDAIVNTGTFYAKWWAQIQPDAGTPAGSFVFSYNLTSDFIAGITECAISALRGPIPSPTNWNYVLTLTTAPTGGSNGSLTATIPATMAPYAFILGEPVPVASGTNICSGNSTILAVTSPVGGGVYNWYDAGTGGNLLLASSTTYTTPVLNSTTTYYVAHMNNITGCASHRTAIVVTVTPAPTVNAGANANVCAGNTYTIAGATATNFTSLSWVTSGSGTFTNNGTLTPTYTPSAADISSGSVTLTLNAGGTAPCGSFGDGMLLTIVALPTADAGSNVTICSGNSTPLNASGGTGYSWSPSTGLSSTSVSNPTANPTINTTYNVTVTNAGGCTASDAVVVTVNQTPTANAGTDVSIANGTSTILSGSASGGSGSYTYTWSPAASLVNANMQNPTTTLLSSTTIYTLTVTDNVTGCQKTDQVTVTVSGGVLSATAASTPTSICNGQTMQLNVLPSGGSGTYTYTWASNPAGFSSAIINPTANPTGNTTYTVTVNDGFTSVIANTTVTVYPIPVASAGSNVAICTGNATTLNASGGATYSWSPSNGLSATNIYNPTANPASTTLYTVIVTSAQGCTNTSNVTVTVNALPTASAGSDIAICTGNSASLSASGGSTYAWSPGTGLSSVSIYNPIASPTLTSTYTVVVTNSNGCTASDNIIVTVNNLPAANAGSDAAICPGNSTQLTASGGTTYSWSPAFGLSNTNIYNPIASPSSTTNYAVTVTDVNGCSAIDNVSITVNPIPNADAGSDVSICPGSSTNLSASGGISYAWSPAGGLSSTNIYNPVASPISDATYTVTVTDGNGCSASDNVSVSILTPPVADAGSDASVCPGNSTVLNATGGVSYAWSPAAGLSSATISNPIATPANSTSYSVTVTDANGCTNQDAVLVTVYNSPIANAGNDTSVCELQSITLTASGGTNYLWSNGDITQSITVSPGIASTYYVTVTDAFGCSASDNVNVSITTKPVITTSADPGNQVYMGQSVTVTASPASYTNYIFYTNSGTIYSGTSNSFELNSISGNDTIFVIATDNSCVSEPDSELISIKPIPNAFTPRNNDGVNDLFLKNLDLTVFNRWGEKIYTGKDGWDGKYNGKYVSKGTYYFTIRLSDINGNISEIKGSVTVAN